MAKRCYNFRSGLSPFFNEKEFQEVPDGLSRLRTLIKKSGGGAAITTLYLKPFLQRFDTDSTCDAILRLIANCLPATEENASAAPMVLQIFPRLAFEGHGSCFMCHHLYKPNYHYRENKMLKQEHWRPKKHYCLKTVGAPISCSSGKIKDADQVFSMDQLSNAHVIYCVAPAMGHNQEAHPESHFRVPAITSALEKGELTPKECTFHVKNVAEQVGEERSPAPQARLFASIFNDEFEFKTKVMHRGSDVIELQNFKSATIDDIATIHARAYVSGLEKAMSQASQDGLIFIEGSGPTYATATTFQESLIAAGAGISLVDSVIAASSISRNPPVGFALIRPPGHHAIPKGPMGFCVFGNIAVAARHAQHAHGLKKVFIIDFDVHHGNGTSDAFYDDPDIFFLSTHQDGSYPGTGKIDEVGHGNGEGTTLNLPLPGGSGDTTMRFVFEEVIVPCAQRFKPDIILVSAGYDAHVLDPLASLQFTTGTYYMLASKIKELAADLCKGRCIFFLEGGYNLQSLSYSVADSFRAFLNEPSLASLFDDPAILYEEPSTKVRRAIERVKHIHSL